MNPVNLATELVFSGFKVWKDGDCLFCEKDGEQFKIDNTLLVHRLEDGQMIALSYYRVFRFFYQITPMTKIFF